jgi:hypothetical protein
VCLLIGACVVSCAWECVIGHRLLNRPFYCCGQHLTPLARRGRNDNVAHQGRLCACCFEAILARIDSVWRTTVNDVW